MAYLFVFAMTIGTAFLYEHAAKGTQKLTLHIVKLFIILIPAVFAGLRDVSVGTDNESYLSIFNYCLSHTLMQSISGFSSSIVRESVEGGFILLTWICSRIVPNYHFYNFLTSLITMALVVIGAEYYKSKISFTAIIATYLFVFFCPNLNYVRQAIALAMAFIAWKYAEQQKLLKFIILIAAACTMHISAIIVLPVYMLFMFKTSDKYGRNVLIVAFAMIVVVYAGPQLVYRILLHLAKLGIRTEVLLKYSRRFADGSYSLNLNFLTRFLPQLVIGGILYKKMCKIDENNKIYYSMVWIQMPIVIMGSIYDNFARLALYYHYAVLMLFPGFIRCVKNTRTSKISTLLLTIFLVVYWLLFTVNNHYNFLLPVYPYKTFF